jgi:hypothetical protein
MVMLILFVAENIHERPWRHILREQRGCVGATKIVETLA